MKSNIPSYSPDPIYTEINLIIDLEYLQSSGNRHQFLELSDQPFPSAQQQQLFLQYFQVVTIFQKALWATDNFE